MNCKTARYSLSLEIDGRLDEGAQSKLSEHLDRCEECRAYAAGIRNIDRVLDTLPDVTRMNGGWLRLQAHIEQPQERRTVFPRYLAPIGAAIILLAAIAYLGVPRTPAPDQPIPIAKDTRQPDPVRMDNSRQKPRIVVQTPGKSDETGVTKTPPKVRENKPTIKRNPPVRYRPLKRSESIARKEAPAPDRMIRDVKTPEPRTEMVASAETSGQGISHDLDSLVDQGFNALVEAGNAQNPNGGGENL